MGTPLEKELKYHLREEDYRRLLKRLGPPRAVHYFRNIFFDTPDLLLNRRKVGLRIRLDRRSAWLTLKRKPKASRNSIKGFSVREEYECKLPLSRGQKIVRGSLPLDSCHNTTPYTQLVKSIPSARLKDLIPLGEIRTVRRIFRYDSMTLELDRCRLFDESFFELEIETLKPLQVKARIELLFSELAVPLRLESQSKLARFIKAWKLQGRQRAQ